MGSKFKKLCLQRNVVGESPIWDEINSSLYWVDIISKKICRYSFKTAETCTRVTQDFPTAIALRKNNPGAVVAFGAGVSLFDFETGATENFCRPDPKKGNRLNEGKCDPLGRFWVGSMQTNLNPDGSEKKMDRNSGALFCVDSKGAVSRHTEYEFGISNTMGWSPDRKKFYFGDTLRNTIFVFDYDEDNGKIHNQKVFLQNYPHGFPDGSCVDESGCLWNARFGGQRIIRISPGGKIDQEIKTPATNPTACTFAGESRKTLCVVSAQFTLSAEQLQKNPCEGGIFYLKTKIAGLPDYRFSG